MILRMRGGSLVASTILLIGLYAPLPVLAIEHDRPGAPPYKLAGNRLVFTTWYFVRPGQAAWLDAQGNDFYAHKSAHDELELRFDYADRPRGVRLVVEPAQHVGPLIGHERPWEERGLKPITVLHEEGKYRLWCVSQNKAGDKFASYLESTDGRNWQRPNLGLVEFGGNRDNNLLPDSVGAIFRDPTAPPAERYKSAWHGKFDPKRFEEFKKRKPWSTIATEMDGGQVHAILAAVSPDGLQWKRLPEPIGIEPTDTLVVAYYDERLRKYVMYTRSYMIGPRAEGFAPPSAKDYQSLARRAIGRTESDRFDEFAPALTIVEPGPDMSPTDQYYTNCRTTVPGAPDHHLMFPAIFHLDSDDTSLELHASYDGKLWHRLPGSPVLTTSDFGQWDGGCIFSCPNLVELRDGSWALPYTGYATPHKYPHVAGAYDVGFALWPKGRLVALEARDEGAFTTEPIVAPGSKLRINAVVKRTGSILIEAADLSGKPITGRAFADARSIFGDQFWTPVTWKDAQDIGVKPGEPIVLRFRMSQAKIYGLQFE